MVLEILFLHENRNMIPKFAEKGVYLTVTKVGPQNYGAATEVHPVAFAHSRFQLEPCIELQGDSW